MLRASTITATTILKRTTLGICGATAIGGTALGAYAYSDSGAGFRREVRFWSGVGPIVADYYLKTASSSPLVKYQRWRLGRDNAGGDRVEYSEKRNDVLKELHEKHAPQMLKVMLDLKGLYIKLGQVLSVTALPLPEPYRVQFRTLQSDVPGWEQFNVIKAVLEKELGRPLADVFESIEEVPCGAASIGQAHRARLKDESGEGRGRAVIVKVQYPDASWQVPADIQCVGYFLLLCVWAGVVDDESYRLSFDEFSRQFLSELDYAREQENLNEVYKSSLDPTAPYLSRNVVIPEVYKEYCSEKVICMSYLPGPKLEAEAKRQLAILGIDTSKGLKQIVSDAANNAAKATDAEAGELVRRVTKRLDKKSKSPFSWDGPVIRTVERFVGVDGILWAVRFFRRILLLSQATAVSILDVVPLRLVPSTWNTWADSHRTAAAQASQLTLTKSWLDALFDVHGHQVFSLGLFNADPHPGNILVIEEEDGVPSTKLGLIDYGQCKRLTPDEQVRIARLVISVAENESDDYVAAAFRALGIKTKNDSTEFLANFARLMFGPMKQEHLHHSWHIRLHELDRVQYFPKELSMVYRTSLLLRGLGISLQMNYSISNEWKYHAQQAIQRNQLATS